MVKSLCEVDLQGESDAMAGADRIVRQPNHQEVRASDRPHATFKVCRGRVLLCCHATIPRLERRMAGGKQTEADRVSDILGSEASVMPSSPPLACGREMDGNESPAKQAARLTEEAHSEHSARKGAAPEECAASRCIAWCAQQNNRGREPCTYGAGVDKVA